MRQETIIHKSVKDRLSLGQVNKNRALSSKNLKLSSNTKKKFVGANGVSLSKDYQNFGREIFPLPQTGQVSDDIYFCSILIFLVYWTWELWQK